MKNAQLWKRILHQGFAGDHVFESDSKESLSNRVVTSPIIVVASAIESPTGWDSINNACVPFPAFWIEGPAPAEWPFSLWGALVESETSDGITKVCCHCFFQAKSTAVELLGGRVWVEGAAVFRIDSHGKPMQPVEAHANEDRIAVLSERLTGAVCVSVAGMVCDALVLLGCKNVGLDARDSDPADAKRATKRFGLNATGYRYHVLVVRPPGAKSDAPGQEIGNMPRHVCRGHFAEYGPEFGKGLLFGKLAGRFYIPPHVKGDAKNGIVEKDYEVRAST